MNAHDLKTLADKQAAAMAVRLQVEARLAAAQRSADLDLPTIEVIAAGIRTRKPIGKCTVVEIKAYAERCEFDARRARDYLAKRKRPR